MEGNRINGGISLVRPIRNMLIGKIESPTLKEIFINKIESEITQGRLKPGDKLPSERQFQEETNISRSVIHSALVTLEKKGLIEIRNRNGAYVLDYQETGTIEALNAEIHHNGGTMTKKQVQDFFECKNAIIGSSLKKLAENHTPEDIAVLRKLLDTAQQVKDQEEYYASKLAKIFFKFQRSVCSLSGNDFYPLLMNEFKPIIIRFWEDSIISLGGGASIRYMTKLIDDIENGDSENAVARLYRNSESYINNYK